MLMALALLMPMLWYWQWCVAMVMLMTMVMERRSPAMHLVTCGSLMSFALVMGIVICSRYWYNGHLPLTCGDANGNGDSHGNGDGMPIALSAAGP